MGLEVDYTDSLHTKYGEVFQDGTVKKPSGEIDLKGTVILKGDDPLTADDKLKQAVLEILRINRGE